MEIDFITGSTKKCLAAMVLPMMAAMFLNMAYNLVVVSGLEICWEKRLMPH